MRGTWWRVGVSSPDPVDSDALLVQRRRAGDQTAFTAIYRRHAPAAAAIAGRLLRNPSDVEDVVQETFLIVYEQLERLAEPAALRGWIARIAISRAHRRFRRRQLAQIDATAQVDQQISSDASPEQCAELALIDRALDMPLELRVPWMLRRALGERLEEVALACGCSLATVKRRVVDADAMLAHHVQALGLRPDRKNRKPTVRARRSSIARRSIA